MVLQQLEREDLFHHKADEASRPKSDKFLKYLADKKASKYRHTTTNYKNPSSSSAVGDYTISSNTTRSYRPNTVPETARSCRSSAASRTRSSVLSTPPNSMASTRAGRQDEASSNASSTVGPSSSRRPRTTSTTAKGRTSRSISGNQHDHVDVRGTTNIKESHQGNDARSPSLQSNSNSASTTTPVPISISHRDRAAFLSNLAAAASGHCSSSNLTRTRREAAEQHESGISYDESRNPSSEEDHVQIEERFTSGDDERSYSSRSTTILLAQEQQERRRRNSSSSSSPYQKNSKKQDATRQDVTPPPRRPALSISQRVAKASRYSAIKEARQQERQEAARTSTSNATTKNTTSQLDRMNAIRKKMVAFDQLKQEEQHTSDYIHSNINRRSSRPRSASPFRHQIDRDTDLHYRRTNDDINPVLDRYSSQRGIVMDSRYPSKHGSVIDRYPSERGLDLMDGQYPSDRAVISSTYRAQTPSSSRNRSSGGEGAEAGWKNTMPPFVKKLSDIFMGNDIAPSHHHVDIKEIPPVSSIEIGPVPTENSFVTSL